MRKKLNCHFATGILLVAFLLLYCQKGFGQDLSNDSIAKLLTISQKNLDELNNKASLENAQIVLDHAYLTMDDILAAKAYNIIALNYDEFSDREKAINILKKAFRLVKPTNEFALQFEILNNLANVYKPKDAKMALNLYNQALLIDPARITSASILFCKINMVETYYFLKEFERGFSFLLALEREIFASKSILFLTHYHILSGDYFAFKQKFDQAENHYIVALGNINRSKVFANKPKYKLEIHKTLSDFYNLNHKSDLAYQHLKQYLAARDELYTFDYIKTVANYASQIDNEDYRRELVKIEKLNEQQQKTIYYSRIIYSLLIIIALFLLYSIFYLIKTQRQKNELIKKIEIQNTELELAKENAENIADMKTQFISKVSHELRTPLYSVIGLTNILEQDFDILKNNKILNALKFSADYLMNLINDLLQLQKIEANAVKIEVVSYDLRQGVNSIIESLDTIAKSNNNVVETNFENCLYKIIEIDRIKLNQILYNLLSNSLKFTKNGRVTLTVFQEKIDESKIKLHFRISDTGIGITEENLTKMFEKFVQFHTQGTDYQGTGLGLSIVKQLVDMLGGKINVTSKYGVGTTFSFFIPCTISKQVKIEATHDLISELNLKNVRILLVENNEINRLVNQRVFKNYKIPCTMVASAHEALELLNQTSFDVILTDINMPEMNGFEMTKKIREQGINIPIIALTAYNKSDILKEIKDCGINDVVTKPFDFDILLRCIYSNLNENEKESN